MKWRFLFGIFFIYPIAKLLLRLKVLGRENIPQGGAIIVANHTSNFDPPLLVLAAKRELYFLAKEELFCHSKFFRWLIKSFNALPLKRGMFTKSLLLEIKDLIERNKTLLLFPEGTRSKDGRLGSFKAGIGFIAHYTGAVVIPCFVSGVADSIIGTLVDRDLAKRGFRKSYALPQIEVRFGPPVYPKREGEMKREGVRSTRALLREFTIQLEKRVRELGCKR